MDDETTRMVKFLRLPALLAHWDEYMAMAQKQGFSHVRLLKYVLEQECLMKSENARTYRLNRANIPIRYVMETYPFDRQPKLDKKKILALYDAFDYVAKSQNIIFVGPAGCGKTGLATSFLIEAIHRGHTGRYVLFPDLVGELFKSVADHSEQRAIKRYLSYDCLLVDELDYVEVEPVQVGLFFTLMHKRHLKKPTLITSNLLCAAAHNKFNVEHIVMRSSFFGNPAFRLFFLFFAPHKGSRFQHGNKFICCLEATGP